MKALYLTRKLQIAISVFSITVCILTTSSANTITAASAAYSDVSDAVASALPGDTVIIPPGTNTWSQAISISGISVKGSGTNKTIIIDEVPRASNGGQLFFIEGGTNHLTELSNLQLQGGTTNTGDNVYGTIFCYGSTNAAWRVDHCFFNNLYAECFVTYGNAVAVIDHNTFFERTIAVQDHGAFLNDGNGFYSWAVPPAYGTSSSNVLYIEDNYFTNVLGNQAGACDGNAGARLVFRNNTVWNDMFDNHGTETSGSPRSERTFEIYNNTFNYSSSAPGYPCFAVAMIRGGCGVIYSNTAVGYRDLVALRNFRSTDTFSGPFRPYNGANGTNSWDSNSPSLYLNGISHSPNGSLYLYVPSANWTPNEWVGYTLNNSSSSLFSVVTSNTSDTMYYITNIVHDSVMTFNNGDNFALYYVYAALDQPGRGSGDLLQDVSVYPYTNVIIINSVTGTPSWPRQQLEGIYCWSNILGGVLTGMASEYPGIQEGRDFYNNTPKPGYAPYQYPHPLVSGGSTGGGNQVTNGLVAWWKFNDGSGTTAHDSSGNGNDGTLSGSTLPVWTNNALYFAGTSGYVLAPTNNLPIAFPMTVSYWINISSGGGGAAISRIDASGLNWIGNDSSAYINAWPQGAGEFEFMSVSNAVDDGAWHLITITVTNAGFGAGQGNIYLDGAFQSTGASAFGGSTGSGSQSCYIGYIPYTIGIDSAGYFNGYLSDVRIYTNVLSDSDIGKLYTNGRR